MTLPLPRPGPLTLQNTPGFELFSIWGQACDAIEDTDALVTSHVDDPAPHPGHSTPATVSAAVNAHVGLADPHSQYHTDAKGDARYPLIAHNHIGGDGAQIAYSSLLD